MRLMTFDIGSRNNLGWARATDKEAPTWGVEFLPETGDDFGATGMAFENFLNHQFKNVAKPALVGFVTPVVFNADQPAGNRKLLGMVFLLETLCRRLSINCLEDYEATMRAYFLAPDGTPRDSAAIKKAVVARCNDLGWAVTDHNAADALCVMEFMRAQVFPKDWPSPAERSGLFR